MRPTMLLYFDSQGNWPEISGETLLVTIYLEINCLHSEACEVTDAGAKEDWTFDQPFSRIYRMQMTMNGKRVTEDIR